MNLHAIANPAVSRVNPNEVIYWYENLGQSVDDTGLISPLFADPVALIAQVQSESDAALYYADRVGQNSIIRRFYIHGTQGSRAASIVRPELRGGDYIQRSINGLYYLVDAVLDDFSATSGWVCVRGVEQANTPSALIKQDEDSD